MLVAAVKARMSYNRDRKAEEIRMDGAKKREEYGNVSAL